MKIGIITLPNIGYYNYGAVLQNYALCQFSRDCGLDIIPIHFKAYSNKSYVQRILYTRFRLRMTKKNGRIVIKRVDKWLDRRNKNYRIFISKNIKPCWFRTLSKKSTQEINKRFDKVVVGSDQVWSPQIIADETARRVMFLQFLPPNKKTSYAASFGVDSIPEKLISIYREELLKFDPISVREKKGIEIVKNTTEKEAELHLDPTLLISRDQWIRISKESPYRPGCDYILTYFLGSKSSEIEDDIKSVSRDFDMEVCRMSDTNNPELFSSGPAEFLDMFHHASIVYTDSFHAVVFSIIFGKPFVVFNRVQNGMSNMSSRITSLLEKFHLDNRLPGRIDRKDLFWADYEFAYQVIKSEIDKSSEYLLGLCSECN